MKEQTIDTWDEFSSFFNQRDEQLKIETVSKLCRQKALSGFIKNSFASPPQI